ncbi:extracellular solute-binding protein [uncultured Eudoraea sp.]|uniref:extracellular solute-binding protein n=1 Tax=uncultured Eudoraea sp. TaxID=1035614 RepID=UPI00262D0DD9|nr:extracellular solute-binding protein [uncultured Eudoraea sp.]
MNIRNLKPIFNYFFAITLLLSCNGHEQKEKTITFWSSNASQEILFTAYFADKWNENHSEKLESQPIPEGQSSEEVIMAAVVGRTTPDIYANMWQGLVEMYAKSGVLVPLDTIEGFTDFIMARSGEAVVKEITSADGHIYQIPWKINPFMTIYNEKKIAQLGLDVVPTTYSAYLKAGKDFSKDTDGDGYVDKWIGDTEVKNIWHQRLNNFYPLYLAASNGAPLIKDNKAVFNNEYAVGVFNFLQTIYREGYFAKESNTVGSDKFLAGHTATKWTGAWDVSYLERYKEDDFEYNIAHLPVPDDHRGVVYTYADPKNIVLFNTCKNPALAWEFIKTMIDEAGDLKFLELSGQIPRRQKIKENEVFQVFLRENPKIIPFIDQSNYVYGTDNCEVLIEVLDIISQEYESCVIHNKKTPAKAIADASRAVDILLGNF